MLDAIDQSWGRIDPARAAAAGVKLICGYLSHDPSKNWTADWIKRYHAAGIGVLLNWESDPGRPLLGGPAGAADGAAAVAQAEALIRAVGYSPGSPIGIMFSCDRDTTPAQYPAVDAYYRATGAATHPAGILNGAYGEADLIDHTHAAGLTQVEWQTLAWSNGRVSAEADLYQYRNGQTLANTSVDFDEIRHPASMGAWWPPGSAQESAASAGATKIGDTLTAPTVQQLADRIDADSAHILADLDGTKKRIAEEYPIVMGLDDFLVHLVTALSGQSATLPDGKTVITNLTTVAKRIDAGFSALSQQLATGLAGINQRLDALGAPSADTIKAAVDAGVTEALDGVTAILTFGGKQA